MTIQSGSYAISYAININHFSGLGKGVDGRQINIRVHCIFASSVSILFPVPVYGVVFYKHVIYADRLHCAGTADTNTFSINYAIKVGCSFITCCKYLYGIT